jgi:diguanylate cyclase (GGDEF)-like protein/PAS domain S-box-containing protein
MKTSLRLTAIVSIALAYLAAAKLGFTLAFTAEQVTPIFPPTGLALSALLVFGPRVWPGILLGAFLANITTHEPVLVALAIAGGNTLEAIVAARLLRRFARFEQTLDTLQHALGLVVFGAVASTIVAATIGVTSLCVGGVQPWTAFGPLWLTWWLGDAAGDLLIVPALLTWYVWRDAPRRRIGELGLLLGGLAVTCAGVFAGPFRDAAAAHHSLDYIVFPFLIWAAIRFGTAGAAAANIVTASIATWGTVHGFGPYGVGDIAGHLLFLQLFLAVVSATGLLLGATVSERTAALVRRNAEHAVTRVLADAASGEEAIQRILDVINTDLDWDIGLWWSVDPQARRLRCAEIRCHRHTRFPQFEHISRTRTFDPGERLPGHVWAYAAPQWIPDVLKEHDVPRLQAAAAEGLHGAFAFPISVGHEVLGVFEFCSRGVRRPDDDLLWMFTAIGAEVGQFLSRKRMERLIHESEARKAGMLNAALDCIITVDQHGRVVEFNPAAERTFGYRSAEIVGRRVVDVLVPEAERERCREHLDHCRASGGESVTGRRLEVVGMRADGTRFPAELSITQTSSAAGPLFTGFLRDITRQKRRANQLAFRATHDGLTKLLNRSAFMDRVKEAVLHAREVGGSIAMLFIDLDHFKALNDSLGHLVGDRLLVETGRRLRRCVRPGDAVARLGGDEFAILLERVIDADAVLAMADRVKGDLDRSFVHAGAEVTLSASVGIAMSDRDGDRPEDLLRTADAAMYRAKAAGASRSGRAR